MTYFNSEKVSIRVGFSASSLDHEMETGLRACTKRASSPASKKRKQIQFNAMKIIF